MNSTNGTSQGQLLPRSEGIVFVVAYLLESLAIIIANIFTIAVFLKNKQMRKRPFYLLVNLAVSDLLVGTIAVPVFIHGLAYYFDLWEIKWNFMIYTTLDAFIIFITYASLVNLAVVSLERMHATLRPLKHRVLGSRTYYVLIGLGWTFSTLPSSLRTAQRYDLITSTSFLVILLSFTCFLFTVICASYIMIWIKIKFGRLPGCHLSTEQDRKFTISLFVVTAVSVATWLPARVVFAVLYFHKPSSLSSSTYNRVYFSTEILLCLNSLVNPIIYSFRMPQFKQTVVRLLCRNAPQRQVDAIEMRQGGQRQRHQENAETRPPHSAESNMATANLHFDTWL